MGSQDVSIEYLSAGANRQTAVADWSRGGLLAFGADTNIALWVPKDDTQRGISGLLRGHGDVVKAVTFLPEEEGDEASYLISGANDKSLIVWKSALDQAKFEQLHTAHDHAGAINCITAIRLGSQPAQWLVATGAADASIHIWRFAADVLTLLQSIKTTPKFFPLSLSLSWLGDGGDALALAAAGTKDSIQILTTAVEPGADAVQFHVQATLRGHEGWIRSLSFARESSKPGADVLLASASQDKYVRIWRFHQGQEEVPPTAPTAAADDDSAHHLPGNSPANKAHRITAAGKHFSVRFEALLLGHEDWIYSARWHRADAPSGGGALRLLSASADNSLAIWEADATSGIWVSTVRLGAISREKGATTATGSTGGFWTGLWAPDGRSVACLGRTGSWRRWAYDDARDTWRPCLGVSGHTKAVTGVAWARDGAYLLSTSLDQTTRLHAQWTASGGGQNTWHEMARPQIHGYDLNCIDAISATQFVSGADEKLMRVFSEPRAVAGLLHRLGGIGSAEDAAAMPDAANMPVLGLSNKVVDDDDDEGQPAAADDTDRPPLEDALSRATLWPETEKLYGHGYELSCLAASHDGRLVASACRASSLNHAVLRLFETRRWTELRPPLAAHTLTATRLRFAPDDAFLLSVGRDRQWAVFQRRAEPDDDDAPYALLQANPKGHARMILDCAWAPLTDGRPRLFATAGRDKQIRIWRGQVDDAEGGALLAFTQAAALSVGVPVTAVDFLPRPAAAGERAGYVLAFGTESGRVGVCAVSLDGAETQEREMPAEVHLPKTVMQLAWRPARTGAGAELAVAGEDASLRVYAFTDGFLQGV
ncbi:RNA polymerase II Elongator subunit [Cordyceps militaris CM01]|uniref:Elongator complex protein 2 n=1 Tax=Cordyceps militaris (strain CM01) TaxID=983644 RepID=G3JGJ1_CORMM|nr:RNA polymerase II Elongator subunit [Cordyceps militaris CM01]EGX92408.1 RNA polymerase II Elongator subunit [Cordyceps militaris CM01]